MNDAPARPERDSGSLSSKLVSLLESFALITSVTAISIIDLTSQSHFAAPIIAVAIAPLALTVVVGHRHLASFVFAFVRGRIGTLQVVVVLIWLMLLGMFGASWLQHTISGAKMLSLAGLWTIVLAASAVIAQRHAREATATMVRYAVSAIQVYVALNAVLQVLGVPPLRRAYEVAGRAAVLSMLGIDVQRVYFPLALGINGFGIIAGASTVVSALAVVGSPSARGRILHALALLASVFALLASDSRGAMLFTTLTVAVLLLFRRHPLGIARLLVVASPLYSLAMLGISRSLSGTAFRELSRGTTLLSNRELIWHSALTYLGELVHRDPLRLLFGYGYLGQVTSGVSKRYFGSVDAYLNVANPNRASLHSSSFQNTFDIGLLGTGLLLLGAVLVLSRRRLGPRPLVLAGLFGYAALAGSTDLTMNVYSYHIFFPLLAVMTLAACRGRSDPADEEGVEAGPDGAAATSVRRAEAP